MLRCLLIFSVLISFSYTSQAQPITLYVLDRDEYIKDISEDFIKHAKIRGYEVSIEYIKNRFGRNLDGDDPSLFHENIKQRPLDIIIARHDYFWMKKANIFKSMLSPIDYNRVENYIFLTKQIKTIAFDKVDDNSTCLPFAGVKLKLAYKEKNQHAEILEPYSWAFLYDREYYYQQTGISDTAPFIYPAVLSVAKEINPKDIFQPDKVPIESLYSLVDSLVGAAKMIWNEKTDYDKISDLALVTTFGRGVTIANNIKKEWVRAPLRVPSYGWVDCISSLNESHSSPEKQSVIYLLYNYIISPEVQAKLAQNRGVIIFNTKAADLLTFDKYSFYEIAGDQTFDNIWLIDAIDKDYYRIYKAMWMQSLRKYNFLSNN